jgi:hypothetical protein
MVINVYTICTGPLSVQAQYSRLYNKHSFTETQLILLRVLTCLLSRYLAMLWPSTLQYIFNMWSTDVPLLILRPLRGLNLVSPDIRNLLSIEFRGPNSSVNKFWKRSCIKSKPYKGKHSPRTHTRYLHIRMYLHTCSRIRWLKRHRFPLVFGGYPVRFSADILLL